MIKNFNEFINENFYQNDNGNIYDKINAPFNSFLERVQERVDFVKTKITAKIQIINNAIETILEKFDNIIVGEPEIDIDSDLYSVNVKIHTNVPYDEEDESPARNLEDDLYSSFRNTDSTSNVFVEVETKPDEYGNCIINIESYVVMEKYLGIYTDIIKELGEEY